MYTTFEFFLYKSSLPFSHFFGFGRLSAQNKKIHAMNAFFHFFFFLSSLFHSKKHIKPHHLRFIPFIHLSLFSSSFSSSPFFLFYQFLETVWKRAIDLSILYLYYLIPPYVVTHWGPRVWFSRIFQSVVDSLSHMPGDGGVDAGVVWVRNAFCTTMRIRYIPTRDTWHQKNTYSYISRDTYIPRYIYL